MAARVAIKRRGARSQFADSQRGVPGEPFPECRLMPPAANGQVDRLEAIHWYVHRRIEAGTFIAA